MATAADITADIQHGIASLGVPWWGWAALAVMIIFGALVPQNRPTAEELEVDERRKELEAAMDRL